MSNSLIEVNENKLETIFTKAGIDSVIAQVKEHVRVFVPDITTEEGRKEVAIMGKKINRSKTYIDSLGKGMVSGMKAECKKIDNIRKYCNEELDALKVDFLAPLTEIEEQLKERMEGIKNRAEQLRQLGIVVGQHGQYFSLEILIANLESVNGTIIDSTWHDWMAKASDLKDMAIQNLTNAIGIVEAQEKDKKEKDEKMLIFKRISEISMVANLNESASDERIKEGLHNLEQLFDFDFKEESASAENSYKYSKGRLNSLIENRGKRQAEREEKIKTDAAQKAKFEAERVANAEKEKSDRALREEKERNERELRQGRERAERELAKKLEDEENKKLQQQKREQDTQHRSKINNEALQSLIECNAFITQEQAKDVVRAIVMGNIKNVEINY